MSDGLKHIVFDQGSRRGGLSCELTAITRRDGSIEVLDLKYFDQETGMRVLTDAKLTKDTP